MLQAGGGRQARRPKGPAALAPLPGVRWLWKRLCEYPLRYQVAVRADGSAALACRHRLPPWRRVAPPAEPTRVQLLHLHRITLFTHDQAQHTWAG